MVNTGLLVLTNPVRVNKLLTAIKDHVMKTLYIQYFPEKNMLVPGAYSVPATQLYRCPKHSQVMANIYALATTVSAKLDVRVLLSSTFKSPHVSIIHTKRPIELVIFDQSYSKNEADTFIQDCLANTSMGCEFITFDEQKLHENNCNHSQNESGVPIEKTVVVGGTFDRLHNGHKILLSEAVLHCSEKLVVGVSDINILKGKVLWELIEPCSTRIRLVKDFLEDVDPNILYNVFPLHDIYGPTKDDPNMDLIIVSEETVRGAVKINELRAEKNMKPLDVHVVKLVKDENVQYEHEESKISSSNQRIRLLGTRLKEPTPKNIPPKPYIIGLTGGIASGKSSVANKLENLGAGIVNCDKIAHELYEPGKHCYNLIVEHFGKGILAENGFINRVALGNLVFNDKVQLGKLNKLVWPSILEEAKRQIDALHKKGCEFVVMEAAVLIQAEWQPHCHEIWTCIIPEEETIKRLIERNNITEEEAKLRIRAQPSNSEQVKEANVVVSTLWSYDVTQQQVQRAWSDLMSYLNNRNGR